MTHTREDILARLAVVLATIPNVRRTARNTAIVSDTRLPAVYLFDGDEEAADSGQAQRQRSRLMHMKPEIVLLQQASEPGSDLNTLLAAMQSLIAFDAPLLAIIGTNGWVNYDSCSTDFGYGRSLHGGALTQWTIQYPLVLQPL